MFSPSRRANGEEGEGDDSFTSQTSNLSSGALKDRSNAKVPWRGRKAAANASHLPIVNKRDLFSLSWNAENNLNDAQLDSKSQHSAELRLTFFEALANSFFSGRWFSEAAVCHAHSLAIIGKELVARDIISIDWSLFDAINADITSEEEVFCKDSFSILEELLQRFTVEDFMVQVEKTIQTLTLSERFEAIGPLCRLAIPIYEDLSDYKKLATLYGELQLACNRAAELKSNGKRHFGSYFRVVFYGHSHFGNEHKSEWIYRESGLTSLAEACDRMTKSLRKALGHDNVEVLPANFVESRLKPTTAYVLITHVEPCLMTKIGGVRQKSLRNFSVLGMLGTERYGLLMDAKSGNEFRLIDGADDPMDYHFHTNVRAFVYMERVDDSLARADDGEAARHGVKRTILIVERCFPSTKRRQRVVERVEFAQSPLEVACECILLKVAQLRRIIDAAEIPRGNYDGVPEAVRTKKLDLTRLQLLLQGTVSPMVNAGVLSYAETFTAPDQQKRYGSLGISRLVSAFKILVAELYESLNIHEAAIGNKRSEYQTMLRKSFSEMIDKLWTYFDGESFLPVTAQRPISSMLARSESESTAGSSELDRSFCKKKFCKTTTSTQAIRSLQTPANSGDISVTPVHSNKLSAKCLLRFNINRRKSAEPTFNQ